jgi:hypothetical protein
VSEIQESNPYDLNAIAALAIEGLTKLIDEERAALPYFIGEWCSNPPRAEHNFWDYGDGSGRLLDALTLCSIMATPSARAQRVIEQIESWVIKQCAEDGLSWVPVEPWVRPWGDDALFVHAPLSGKFCEISWSQRGSLMGLLSKYMSTGSGKYLDRAKGIIDGLYSIAIKNEYGLYFPDLYYQEAGWQTDRFDVDPVMVEYNAASLACIVRFYEFTRYRPAYELATGMLSFAMLHTKGYDPDGTIRFPAGNLGLHFHTRSNFVLGVLKYGLLEERSDLISWAESSFDQLLGYGTEFGWFPEGIGARHGEICCTTDMIEIALLLGKSVDRKYFALAEKFGRNHLIESQWRSLSKLDKAVKKLMPMNRGDTEYADYVTTDNVVFRQYGAFSSRPALNDGFHLDATALMQCCNAAGARGIYDLWRYSTSASFSGNILILEVNLRFSVENDYLKLVCHEPIEGIVYIEAKYDCTLKFRLPEGTHSATLTKQGASITELMENEGYVSFVMVKGENIKLEYLPMEKKRSYVVGSIEKNHLASIEGFWRGETLVSVSPKGDYYPLYEERIPIKAVIPTVTSTRAIDSI